MKKGQHMVLSAVLLVLMIIGVVFGVYIFTTDTTGEVLDIGKGGIEDSIEKGNAAIMISSVEEGEIEIKNIGRTNIPSDFGIYFNGTPGDTEHDCPEYIEEGEICSITVNSPNPCDYNIEVHGPYGTWEEAEAEYTCS